MPRWDRSLFARRAVWAVGVLALTAASAASADPGPTIEHQPIATAPPHLPVEIRAHIVSNSNFPVYKPTLYVKPTGMTSFTRIDLVPLKGVPDIYTATIPADLVTDGVDYYIEAFDKDGNGPSSTGTGVAPLHIKVTAAAGPAPLVVMAGPASTSPSTAPGVTSTAVEPPSSSSLPADLLMGAGGAVAIAGAVILGVGVSNASTVTTAHLAPTGTPGAETAAGGVVLAAGVIAAGVGLYLYFTGDSQPVNSQKAADRAEAQRHPTVASLLMDF